jgi:hypothetical protein
MISAVYSGATKTAQLIVNAPVDSVAIQRAEYRSKSLRIDATSTEGNAVLQVYVTSTGAFIGTMTKIGRGSYDAKLPWPTNPKNVTVRSSFGGSASKQVTLR